MSSCTTHGVRVDVTSHYQEAYSDPAQGQWLFSYNVCITNVGRQVVQLLSRHWVVTHGTGKVEEVRGAVLLASNPSSSPVNTSSTPVLPARELHGAMPAPPDGDGLGERFDADIQPFSLADPDTMN